MEKEVRLIDVNSAVERLKEAEQEMRVVRIVGHKAVSIDAVIQFLEERPTVDAVEVKHGRFMYVRDDELIDHWECSVCHGLIPSEYIHWNYCPSCGAKMDGDGDAK